MCIRDSYVTGSVFTPVFQTAPFHFAPFTALVQKKGLRYNKMIETLKRTMKIKIPLCNPKVTKRLSQKPFLRFALLANAIGKTPLRSPKAVEEIIPKTVSLVSFIFWFFLLVFNFLLAVTCLWQFPSYFDPLDQNCCASVGHPKNRISGIVYLLIFFARI